MLHMKLFLFQSKQQNNPSAVPLPAPTDAPEAVPVPAIDDDPPATDAPSVAGLSSFDSDFNF